jgi:outer membrane biosynthesis protein TonB
MMAVDDKGTIDLFIDMLVDPEKRLDATEKQVCDALKDITAEDRGYDAARDDKGREEAVQRWIAWWKQTRPVYKRPVRAQEFTPAPAEKPKTPTPPAPAEPEKPKAPAPQPQPAKPEAKPEPQPAPAKDDSATKAPAETKAPEKPAAK